MSTFVIAIAGHSGAGKSTLMDHLVHASEMPTHSASMIIGLHGRILNSSRFPAIQTADFLHKY